MDILDSEVQRSVENSPAVIEPPSVRAVVDVDAIRRDTLRNLGIYTPQTLHESIRSEATIPYLVEGLLRTRSINLLVGDSGLGKTPLAIQIGVCVAAGIPLFGFRVQQGPVLYCDAESGKPEFFELLQVISRFLGLSEPPSNFHMWSPNWDGEGASSGEFDWQSTSMKLKERVKAVGPSFVVADALRTFWPEAEAKNQAAAETIASLRKLKKVTWLLLHHRRKLNQQAPVVLLDENPHAWFQEAAGAHALINQTDTRLGLVPASGQADLVLGGLLRFVGPMSTLDLARVIDDQGTPVGYRLLTGTESLRPEDRSVFSRLPDRFRFKDAEAAMGGKSASNVKRFLDKCILLGVVQKDGTGYGKISSVVERVECVE